MTASKLIDQPARERIATALEENLCVEAAAGTGKTTVLVDRVVNLIAHTDRKGRRAGRDHVHREGRGRARHTGARPLEEESRRATGEVRARLETAARDLYRAHIETIHSFATALLRERPVEAELDPLFEVREGLADSLDFDAAYERFQDELLTQPLPELDRALQRGLGLRELREASEHLNEHRYLLKLQVPAPLPDDVPGAVSELRQIADELNVLLTQHNPPGDDKAIPSIEAIGKWVTELEAEDLLTRERMLIRGGPKAYASTGTAGNWGAGKPRIKELRERYGKLVAETGLRLQTNALLGLLPHVESFVEDYENQRRRAGKAGFDDLLFWARDLLHDSPAARDYFRGRFRAVLIDEFQDTDPVQAELALLLTSDDDPGEDWRRLTPGPGRLTRRRGPKAVDLPLPPRRYRRLRADP